MAEYKPGDRVKVVKPDATTKGKTGAVQTVKQPPATYTVLLDGEQKARPYAETSLDPAPSGAPVAELVPSNQTKARVKDASSYPVGQSAGFMRGPSQIASAGDEYPPAIPVTSTFAGTAAKPWVGVNVNGKWSQRIKTVQATVPIPDPAPIPNPIPTPVPTGFRVGFGNGGNVVGSNLMASESVKAAQALHPGIIRISPLNIDDITKAKAQVQQVLDLGATPLCILWMDTNTLPNDTNTINAWADKCVSTINALPDGILYEGGNELDYYSPGKPRYDCYEGAGGGAVGYAAIGVWAGRYAYAMKRIGSQTKGSRGVIPQADGDTENTTWVGGMKAAVPDLQNYVAGWTGHLYGANWLAKLNDRHNHLPDAWKALGWHISESGVPTDDGRAINSGKYGWPDQTYQQAGVALRNSIEGMHADGRIKQVNIYQATDQDPSGQSTNVEAYFGVTKNDGSAKPGVTEVAASLLDKYRG